MTDQELLEFAAKASGLKVLVRKSGYWMVEVHDRGMRGWNPFLDDGDALRLAVKLQMRVHVGTGATSITTAATENHGREPVLAIVRNVNDDPCAATRRAIVRAAAVIGKSMP